MNQRIAGGWRDALITDIQRELEGLGQQVQPFAQILNRTNSKSVHLGVFVEPYLRFILEGKKTVESRFGVSRQPPFGYVEKGDLVLLKRTGGPVCAICCVLDVWYYNLRPETWSEIEQYSEALCIDGSSFWAAKKRDASYATLMRIGNIIRLPEIQTKKIDPRPWVVLISDREKSLYS